MDYSIISLGYTELKNPVNLLQCHIPYNMDILFIHITIENHNCMDQEDDFILKYTEITNGAEIREETIFKEFVNIPLQSAYSENNSILKPISLTSQAGTFLKIRIDTKKQVSGKYIAYASAICKRLQ